VLENLKGNDSLKDFRGADHLEGGDDAAWMTPMTGGNDGNDTLYDDDGDDTLWGIYAEDVIEN
jgi:Ca2+-binding RTX toxin-like protein